MQKNNRFLRSKLSYFTLILSTVVLILVGNNVHCKNPKDYGPPFDSLYPPPDAPRLISPFNDTAIGYTTPFPNDVLLKWNAVGNAEYYQLQVVNDTAEFSNAITINVDDTSTIYTLSHSDTFYWHVRAYNREWTWFTDWSEPWHFYAYFIWFIQKEK
ncbi:MAG: hypothetical protein ACPL28_03395 [bacterium]